MSTEYTIRQEEPKDYEQISALLKSAFTTGPRDSPTEHLLVEQLRQSPQFIKELALVADLGGKVVGYVLLTKVTIRNESRSFPSLALAPVAVLPEYQRKGIGGALMREAHTRAKAAGYTSIMLIGYEDYYPRFGYKRASEFGISFPFDVPDQNAMAVELVENALEEVQGNVIYPDAFHSL